MLRMDKMRQSLAGVMVFVPRKVVALGLVVMLSVAGVCIFRTFAPRTGAASAVRVAQIVTDYPGASAETVAARVTDPVETAAERMGRVRRTASTSYPGRSVVTVELRDDVPAEAVPQAWDELQRRVGGTPLPPGCSAPVVNEDYGEVYDVVYALSGDGFSPADLKAYAKALRRDLRLCADVAKVDLLGDRQQIVALEISRAKIAALGLSPETVAAALAGRTVPTDAGSLRLGDKRIRPNFTEAGLLAARLLDERLSAHGAFTGERQRSFAASGIVSRQSTRRLPRANADARNFCRRHRRTSREARNRPCCARRARTRSRPASRRLSRTSLRGQPPS